ncbi:MAG: Hypothetical protein LKU_01945 [Lactobacillus kefiranofaciens]|uniref:XRE family transcriptional regulator n=1 Tax=Lactobacillus kefiranofaciens TaxID=267818 RepID=A0ABY0MDV4_9LACO|nr:XRE family transcriptional regulator [Lactobacillus kefiranofaciens subsp. kefiranofaciens]KRL30832.1 XRE family transcriptional regulator [Lactobacillus kefiranofaciens subsp. kefirgranum DSM 10550 = JCM 8572]KRM22052.1 XRE family transcriptional regulator [Lactobacillus kefiranofaciens subsp. kefiranofaciens DSM 5016 = JCM 6985]SDA52474.1 hypothetical protein SAMN02983011_01113 [Lactobacillus kefiranofaciens]
MRRKDDLVHYRFLRGEYALKNDRNQMSALFYFNDILTSELDENNIYRLLALNGCSQIYAEQGELEKAEHYYSQVLKNIKDVEIDDPLTILHALAILCDAGEFYGERKMYRESNSLLRYAYKIGANYHALFYMTRILLRQGLNDMQQGKKKEITIQHLNDACAFARINRNRITLEHAKKALKQLEN